MSDLGKILILTGGIIFIVGFVVLLVAKLPGVGRLPWDILIKKDNFTFYFPIASSILLSIILSFLFMLWNRK